MFEALDAVRRATGARSACLLRCTAGLLGLEPPLTVGEPLPEEAIGPALAASVPVPARSSGELAQRLATLAAERRRSGTRRPPLRIVLPEAGGAHLLLVRGDDPGAGSGLALALDALVALLRVAPAPQEVVEACAFLADDGRVAMLADREGTPLAITPLLRQVLGGDRSGSRPVWLQPERRAFFEGIRRHVAAGDEVVEGVPGLDRQGTLRIQRLRSGAWVLASLEGEVAWAAALCALADGDVTRRELTCGLRLAEGKSYREIAAELGVSPDTVKLHLRALYQKLGVDGRDTLVARLAGMAPPAPVMRRAG